MRSGPMAEETLNLHQAPSQRETLALAHLEVAARYLYTNLLPLPLVVIGTAVLLGRWNGAAPLALWAAATIATWFVTLWTLRSFLRDDARELHLRRWTISIGVSLFVSTIAFASVA